MLELANKQLGKFVTPAKEKTPTMCKAPNRDRGGDPKYVCKAPNRDQGEDPKYVCGTQQGPKTQPTMCKCIQANAKAGLHVAFVGPES